MSGGGGGVQGGVPAGPGDVLRPLVLQLKFERLLTREGRPLAALLVLLPASPRDFQEKQTLSSISDIP